jgi:TonB family protein
MLTRPCYESALAAYRRLRGKAEVLVRITETGAVCDTRIVSSALPPTVNQCLMRTLSGADYPPPRGGCIDVTIPLSFEPRDVDAGAP